MQLPQSSAGAISGQIAGCFDRASRRLQDLIRPNSSTLVDYEAKHRAVADLRKLQHALASRHLELLGCNTLPQHPHPTPPRPTPTT
jgi:hypothetical protein